jgi:hypothetical protein
MSAEPWSSERLIRMSGDYWQICTLHAGVRLDVFTAIGRNALTAADIAEKLGTNRRATAMLLNALAAMTLLTKRGDSYANSEASERWLTRDSSEYIGYIILHHHRLMESWSHLDRSVKSGRPNRRRSFASGDEQREWFLMGMFNIAMKTAPVVASQIDLTGRRRLLDLGGGPGTHAIHFCLNNPKLTATVYDLPGTRSFFQKTVARFGLVDRIVFEAGDFVKDEIRGDYDVALLSHILHGEGPESCRRIIKKAIGTLPPGGMIIIHEFILDNGMDSPLHPALFSLNMLLGTRKGQAYSEGQLMDMLAESGAGDIRRLPIKIPGESGVIVASA